MQRLYPMDVTTLLRCTSRIANPSVERRAKRAPQNFFCAVLAVLLAGCSQVSPEYDPINWISTANREVMGWFGDESPAPAPIAEPPPAEGRPFPNLGTVPPPPMVTPAEKADRAKQLAALQADRDAAARADAALRGKAAPAPSSPAGAAAVSPASGSAGPAQASGATGSGTTASANADAAAADAAAQPSGPADPAPAPVIEVPSLPPTAEANAARSAAHLLTTSERRGSVSFGPNATSLGAAGRNTLDAAASSALTNDGRVRLVPAQIEGVPASPDLMASRETSLREALTGAGVLAERITIGKVGARRVDVYDVYVDY